MKKFLLTLTVLLTAFAINATDYKGNMTVAVGSDYDESEVTLSVTEEEGTVYLNVPSMTITVSGNKIPTAELKIALDDKGYEEGIQMYAAMATDVMIFRQGQRPVTADLSPFIEVYDNGDMAMNIDGSINTTPSVTISCSFSGKIVSKQEETGKIYFQDDFEWFAPWVEQGDSKGPTGDTIGSDNPSANAPNLTNKIEGKTLYSALQERGYSFVGTHASSKDERTPDKQIYFNDCYLKFGLTGYQSGISFKVATDVPASETVRLSFDWCSQRQNSGVIDPTELVVIVKNGENEVQYAVPALNWEDGHKLEWVNYTKDFEPGEIKNGTENTIRNKDEQWPSGKALRWFFDNLCFGEKEAVMAGIDDIVVEEPEVDPNAPVEYYNFQGVRVNGENLAPGLYIRRQGNKATKILVR